MAKSKNLVTDPIADMLTRIRNAGTARHDGTVIPYSKIKMEIARILVEEGFLASAGFADPKEKKPTYKTIISVKFKGDHTHRVIQGLRRISKPGLRVYSASNELPKVLNGMGIAIISTSKGIMTDTKAREKNLGGEVLAYVW